MSTRKRRRRRQHIPWYVHYVLRSISTNLRKCNEFWHSRRKWKCFRIRTTPSLRSISAIHPHSTLKKKEIHPSFFFEERSGFGQNEAQFSVIPKPIYIQYTTRQEDKRGMQHSKPRPTERLMDWGLSMKERCLKFDDRSISIYMGFCG